VQFSGKSIVVTGAAQGIGRACALRFAREGGSVVVADCVDPPARAVVDEIRASGGIAEAYIADLSTSAGARGLMATACTLFGRIDVSVHNVGGTIWAKPYWEYSDAQIEAEIQRSLWPTLWCCRAVLPIMLGQKSGSIINIGSVATRGIHRVPYSAAKGAVQALTTCLAMETATLGVRVNCVAPGGTVVTDRTVPRPSGELTEADRAGFAAVLQQTMRDTPQGRFGTVEEQAAAVAFLASDEASYITGQTLYVAGGGVG
jgi:dihydroxycyclohexadiene carboxylate dehydrogenase